MSRSRPAGVRAVVIGGSGQIGCWLLRELAARGHEAVGTYASVPFPSLVQLDASERDAAAAQGAPRPLSGGLSTARLDAWRPGLMRPLPACLDDFRHQLNNPDLHGWIKPIPLPPLLQQ